MVNINKVRTYSVRKRFSKVVSRDFAQPPAKGRSFAAFYNSLPQILKASDLKAVAEAVVKAHQAKKAVIIMAGAHVIKCGLNPVVIELMRRKVITCLCLNGAGLIHDFEIAFQGRTSEDVAANLKSGKFGMAKETAEFLNQAVSDGVRDGLGLGSAVAKRIACAKLPYKKLSLFYNAYRNNLPVCVFIAVGTDIIHQHPSFDASLAGEGALRDFHTLVENVSGLDKGGVVLNFGSAVILPEVFLKALNLARNLGSPVKDFVSANFDMLFHYRPQQNVVARPVMSGGKGYYIIGHHEIMLPLLAQAVVERIS
jgi:hypothetical protein